VSDVSRETGPVGQRSTGRTAAPPPPAIGRTVFGDRLAVAIRYADLLAADATVRGLIGPREVPRLWERHLLNCAVVADLVAPGASVADIGSGAGLPGLVLAVRRPDLQVCLVEPLLRRTAFLDEVVAALGLDNVEVRRARAEELHGRRRFDVVTSRAVAPLDRLARWSLPLVRGGGENLAMKGSSAPAEVATAEAALRRAGAQHWSVETLGAELETPVTVVRIRKAGGGS
jgi:16S rRNA (guanine527-N7)-methyltransferase